MEDQDTYVQVRHYRDSLYFSTDYTVSPWKNWRSDADKDRAAERSIKRVVDKLLGAGYDPQRSASWQTASGAIIPLKLSGLKSLEVPELNDNLGVIDFA